MLISSIGYINNGTTIESVSVKKGQSNKTEGFGHVGNKNNVAMTKPSLFSKIVKSVKSISSQSNNSTSSFSVIV